MRSRFTLACVQMTAADDMAANIEVIAGSARAAKAHGAALIAYPECATMMEPKRALALAKAAPEESHRGLAAFRGLARECAMWMLAGSLTIKLDETTLANRSYLIDPAGDVVASYDKIHMFDVALPGGESYRESATYRPGATARLAALPWGVLGMTVCYDVRFPHLYRALAQGGASMLAVPSAFTRPTGRAHWHVLLRARAIETGCWVFAPAQCGEHAGGRKTYGHSLIIDPWGAIVAEADEAPAVIYAEIDLAKVDEARSAVPSLNHDRSYLPPEPVARSLAAE